MMLRLSKTLSVVALLSFSGVGLAGLHQAAAEMAELRVPHLKARGWTLVDRQVEGANWYRSTIPFVSLKTALQVEGLAKWFRVKTVRTPTDAELEAVDKEIVAQSKVNGQ